MLKKRWLAFAAAGLGSVLTATPAGAQAAAAAQEAKPTTGQVGEKIPAFTAKIARGDKSADFDTTKNAKTTLYVLVGPTCPATAPYVDRLAALEAAYIPKGIDFVYVYPNKGPGESAADKAKYHKDKKFTAALLNDEGAAFTKKLAAMKTGEALIVDKDGKVVYRGGIDDNRDNAAKVKSKHIAQALDEILAGKAVSKASNHDVFG